MKFDRTKLDLALKSMGYKAEERYIVMALIDAGQRGNTEDADIYGGMLQPMVNRGLAALQRKGIICKLEEKAGRRDVYILTSTSKKTLIDNLIEGRKKPAPEPDYLKMLKGAIE